MIIPFSKNVNLYKWVRKSIEDVSVFDLKNKVRQQGQFSLVYMLLVISSVIVCTLGLLTDNVAVVIGGMLISPLMWPLVRVGFAISYRSGFDLGRSLSSVLASGVIGIASAYLITNLSPIQVINNEILVRTAPTLMDLLIALSAGLVAAIALTQKRVADSFAGVAIAISLMPPLCAVGICLALKSYSLAEGALLLFAVNAACITLVTSVVLVGIDYLQRQKVRVSKLAITINMIIVLLLSIPLLHFLKNYSLEIKSYNAITKSMDTYIGLLDPSAGFENIKITQSGQDALSVSADLLIPDEGGFSYEDNQKLLSLLESSSNKKVKLNLRIQTVIQPRSKDEEENDQKSAEIKSLLVSNLSSLNSSLRVSSVGVTKEADSWKVVGSIFTDPNSAPTQNQVTEMSTTMSSQLNANIQLSLTFIPRLTLDSGDNNEEKEISKFIESYSRSVDSNATVSAQVVANENSEPIISYSITGSDPAKFNSAYLQTIKSGLFALTKKDFLVKFRFIQAYDLSS